MQTAGAVATAFGAGSPLHVPVRHETPGFGVLQAPATHVLLWQTLPSDVHEFPSATFTLEQPVTALHVSVVQSFESLQSALFGVPTQVVPEQVSPVVHATPSLHAPTKFE